MPSSDQYQNEARSGQTFVPNNVWGSSPIQGGTEELVLPSGQTCLARRMTIESVLESGMVDQVDILTATVDSHSRQVKGGNKTADGLVIDESILKDTDAIKTIVELADRLMPTIVVSPEIHLHFVETTVGKTKVRKMIPVEDRIPGQAYTDQIGLDDKMFLFDWAMGGLQEFSSFRRGSDEGVGAVESGQRNKGKAKRRPRNR